MELTKLLVRLLAQASNNSTRYIEPWRHGNWFEALVRPFTDAMGVPTLMSVVSLGLAGMLYIFSGSLALPAVVFVLLWGMFIPFLPPQMQTVAWGFLIVVVAFAVYALYSPGGRR